MPKQRKVDAEYKIQPKNKKLTNIFFSWIGFTLAYSMNKVVSFFNNCSSSANEIYFILPSK